MSVLEDLENLFYGRTPPTDVEIQSALRQWKNSVRVATTANGALATAFAEGQTIDGIVLAEGDRILLKDQTDPIENGIYNVSASGAPSRASDMEATTDAASVIVYVNEGTVNADTVWSCTDDSFTEVGVDALTFAPFLPGAGTDTDAIHDNVAGEIQLITLKVTPAAADLLVIEDSAASHAKKSIRVDSLPYVATTRTITAGAGLTGGGDLSANRTIDAVAHADGSIVVNANDIQVGVLATDAQHGNRGRGSLHTVATAAEAGFMSAADKTKLDNGGANGIVQLDANGDASIPRDLVVNRDLDIEGDFTVNPLGVGGFDAATIDNDTGNFAARGTLTVAAGNFSVDGSGNVTLAGTLDGRDVAADGTKLDTVETNADVTDAANVNAAGAVMESDYDAHTVLAATSDNTPVALTVGEATVVGRATGGNIAALTASQLRTLLLLTEYDETNATANFSSSNHAFRRVRCSHATGCTVTVNSGTAGEWAIFTASTAAQSVTVASGTATVTGVPDGYTAETAGQYHVIVVYYRTATVVDVWGSLV